MIEIATAKVSITPSEPCYLCGHAMRTELSTGVRDELECTAIVLKLGDQILIWESFELAGLDKELSDEMRRLIKIKYNLPLQNITLSFVHTHSGPEFTEIPFFSKDTQMGARPGYRQYLIQQSIKAVDECFLKGFTPVRVMAGRLMIEGFYGNRNGRDLICDKSVSLFRFIDGDGETVGGVVNMTCHPTVLGPLNRKLSGDLFGYIKRGIGNKWGVTPLMMQGAAGDMSNRCYRRGDDDTELVRVGDGILSQILDWGEEEEITLGQPVIEPYHYSLCYDPDLEKWELDLAAARERLKTETAFDERKLLLSGISALEHKVEHAHVTVEFDASIIRLGDWEICQIPAELFSCFGLEIKASSHAKYPVIWGYTNYSMGYFVERSQYGQTFESMVSDLPEGEPERITRELAELMAGNTMKSLKCASAKRSITPESNMYLCGYFPPKMSRAAHDDLNMTALLLELNGKKLMWFNLDLCIMTKELYHKIAGTVQASVGIPEEVLFINTTHNHTGPSVYPEMFPEIDLDEENKYRQNHYIEFLCRTAEALAVECMEKIEPVTAYIGTTEIKGYYSNRNGIDKPVDKTASIIRFIGNGQKLVAQWLNMSCHSTVLGPETTQYSADLVGNVCKYIENATGVYPLSTIGCSGDTSTRLYRLGNDFKELSRVVEGVAEQILAIQRWDYLYFNQLSVETVFHHLEYDMDLEQMERERKEAEEQLKTAVNYDEIKILKSIISSIDRKKTITHVSMDLQVHIVCMGDLEVYTFPGELSAKLGLLLIRPRCKKRGMIASYVNDYKGYMIEEEEYGKNYESLSSLIPKGEPEKLIRKIMKQL